MNESVLLKWQISSACDEGACVQVARHGDYVYVRDSKVPNGPVQVYTVPEWAAFIAGAKLGEFDVG
uniref:DUF397 domain-containing protein n=1 Tax=Herbidospora sakaeratensis TaxID=564415 RepID=UPI000780A500|nr:DUF397 domain-containing protein [Herbidospora sakaeratensis]